MCVYQNCSEEQKERVFILVSPGKCSCPKDIGKLIGCLDTEGSFVVERVVEIATAAIQHIASVAERSGDSGMLQITIMGVA
jgi:hypothetical protein